MRSGGRSVETDARPPALAVEGLRKSYPAAPEPVLADVDLVVDGGRLVHVGGVNGAGKTTLLRLLAGLLEPDAGTVAVDGVDPRVERRAYQRRVAYVSAGNAGLYARLTVEQHLRIWARMALVPLDERARRIRGSLAAFELAPLGRRRVDRLSMGQRQRLRLALALLPPSRLILLDEPQTSLDGRGEELLAATLEVRLAMGAGVVWCSPGGDMPAIADERLVLEGGRPVRA